MTNDVLPFAFPRNARLADWMQGEVRCLVRLGGVGTFCGYVGLPAGHPLAETEQELPVHGGVTFGQWGAPDSPWPEGWYWWGWDYAHAWDWLPFAPSLKGRKRHLATVKREVRLAAQELVRRAGAETS